VTLREVLVGEAAGLEEMTSESGEPGDETLWSRGGTLFAVLRGDGLAAEFKLDAAVAAAATRTPDVASSSRGQGWVTFQPISLDAHAADRAKAWLASAYRQATSG
jgi:hypothetical protein